VPKSFYFTPSYFCTSDCLMCGVAKYKRDQRWGYGVAEARAEVDAMALDPGDVLEISGGEPTAYKHLADIATYAKQEYGARVLVLSHGRHLKIRRLAERLAHSGIERFVVPVFSHVAETHDALTQVRGSLAETFTGLDNLADLGVATTIKLIPMATNYRDLLPTFQYCQNRYPGMKYVISGYQMMGEAFTNRDLVSPRHRDVGREIEKTLDAAQALGADASFAFVPMCVVDPVFWKEYRSGYANETVVSPDKDHVDSSTEANYVEKPDVCADCAVRSRCQWAWYAYSKIYGTDELTPFAARQAHRDVVAAP